MNPGLRVCTQCGFTYAEFQARGLLGCPQCYPSFGELLWADLLQLHPGLYRRPAPAVSSPAAGDDFEETARLREMLADALREERYEDAAALRLRLRAREGGAPGSA